MRVLKSQQGQILCKSFKPPKCAGVVLQFLCCFSCSLDIHFHEWVCQYATRGCISPSLQRKAFAVLPKSINHVPYQSSMMLYDARGRFTLPSPKHSHKLKNTFALFLPFREIILLWSFCRPPCPTRDAWLRVWTMKPEMLGWRHACLGDPLIHAFDGFCWFF